MLKVGKTSGSLVGVGGWVRNWNGLSIPDLRAVLSNGPVRGELTRLGNTDDCHFSPLSIVPVSLINAILGINVAVEIEAGDVVVTAILQMVEDWVNNTGVTEEARFDSIENSLQTAADVVSSTLVHCFLASSDALDILSKDEHVLSTDLFGNLDISAVHGSDNETAVHYELHVGSTGSLCTSSGDMLRELGSRNDNLC